MHYYSSYLRTINKQRVVMPAELVATMHARGEYTPSLECVLYHTPGGIPLLPISPLPGLLDDYFGNREAAFLKSERVNTRLLLTDSMMDHLEVENFDRIYVCGFYDILMLQSERYFSAYFDEIHQKDTFGLL